MSPFTREQYIDAITNALSYLKSQVELNNTINKYSINIEAEDFYAGFLNKIYGFKLKNGNHTTKNIPSIDLYEESDGDNGQRVAVQVTSNNDASKITKTLESFVKNDYQKLYTRLIILMITEKKKYRTEFSFSADIGIKFDQNRDILDIHDLIRYIDSIKEDDHIRRIYEYLKKKLGSIQLSTQVRGLVYITERPAIGVDHLFGREQDIEDLKEAVLKRGKVMISGVGGIGKTELVKSLLMELEQESSIKEVAWIPYDNHDLRGSIKQALNLNCSIENAWMELQSIVEKAGEDLLLVVDNVEQVGNDEYLSRLGSLPCRVLMTSRQKKLSGFPDPIFILPLKLDACRDLFYAHYQLEERDNLILNDIIELTARLTIMIVFIAKVAYLEGMSLSELYRRLVEKGFKLSEEDVSSEHEKLHNDATIIRQMCILFTLVDYSEEDKKLLTYASIIPGLPFDHSIAKKWFNEKKNSRLQKLFNMGMLEHVVKGRKHIYWMHSVIATAIREQQKEVLYETALPFIHSLYEDLDYGEDWGKGYTKLELIPFSWSVADIFEGKWDSEDDAEFLLRLYYVCFEASNYPLCQTLIETVLRIDKKTGDPEKLIRDNKNRGELLLRLDETDEALRSIQEAERILSEYDPDHKQIREWAYLWHCYGNLYYHVGMPLQALEYYQKATELDEGIGDRFPRELATDYSSLAAAYQQMGDLHKAYEMLIRAMETDPDSETDSESIMLFQYMGSLCTDLYAEGYLEYAEKAEESYSKAISFREAHSAKNSSDMADLYLEYSNFLYQTGNNQGSRLYTEKARKIYRKIYGDDCTPVLRCRSNIALIMSEEGKLPEAIEEYADILEQEKQMPSISYSDYAKDCENYATLLEQAGLYEESRRYWEEDLKILKQYFPEDSIRLSESYFGIANTYLGQENYTDAITYLNKLIAIAQNEIPKLRVALYKLGDCYAFEESYEQALNYYKKSLELCDNSSHDDEALVCTEMAYVYYWMGNIDECLAYKTRAEEAARLAQDDFITDYVGKLDTLEL